MRLVLRPRRDQRVKFQRGLLIASIMIPLLCTTLSLAPSYAAQGTKIELSFSNDRPLRGDILVVSGRLSSTIDDRPIPLVSVSLQYNRVGDTDATRVVSVITSNPSGLFQDLVNTTYLLRIGPWVVNASFPSQLGYQATTTTKTFTIVVQPSLSLYISASRVTLGQEVEFNGLLFACIPCINDRVIVALTRPDNSSVMMQVNINATGGPYPGGYYEGRFIPNMLGQWHIRAVWAGNDVTLPAYSEVEVLSVETPSIVGGITPLQIYSALIVVVLGAIAVVVILRRQRRDS